jgi:hypothetical protein
MLLFRGGPLGGYGGGGGGGYDTGGGGAAGLRGYGGGYSFVIDTARNAFGITGQYKRLHEERLRGERLCVDQLRRPMAPTAKLPSEQWPEFQYPSSHRFVGDIQTALGEQIFHLAVAETGRLFELLETAYDSTGGAQAKRPKETR